MISIITSLYKSESHLPSFIRRVKKMHDYLNKKNIKHEFIILPNNQNESEAKILESIGDIIRVLPRELETLYATWNFGIDSAKYENICFWNVDDIRFGKAIISGLEDLKSVDVVYFPFIYFRYLKIWKINILAKIRIFYPPIFNEKKFLKEMHCGPFFMTKKAAFNKIGLFDETFSVTGDYEWCVRATMNKLNFLKNNTIAGIFTSDGTTLSGSHSKKHEEENERVRNMN